MYDESSHTIGLSSEKPVVFITGCGSGIGNALAKVLHRDQQYRIMATLRSEADAERLRFELGDSEDLIIAPLNITDSESR